MSCPDSVEFALDDVLISNEDIGVSPDAQESQADKQANLSVPTYLIRAINEESRIKFNLVCAHVRGIQPPEKRGNFFLGHCGSVSEWLGDGIHSHQVDEQ